MTIEAKLEALTIAVNNNTAALLGKPNVTGTNALTQATVAPANVKAAGKAAGATAPLTYEDVRVPFLALVKKNRDAALATIAPLDHLNKAKPEQYASILAKVVKALADAEAAA